MTVKFNADAKGDVLYIVLIFNFGYYKFGKNGEKKYKYMKLNTGEKIKSGQWDFGKQRCKILKGFPDAHDINLRLENIKTNILNIYRCLKYENIKITSDDVADKLSKHPFFN